VITRTVKLDQEERHTCRIKALNSARVALAHAGDIEYSEGANRWSGIADHRRAYKGQYPAAADCSAFYTWCLWDGTLREHPSDFVNGEQWLEGYTGTMIQHGSRVRSSGLLIGDAVFYGPDAIPSHVAFYAGDGMVISHGSPGGPRYLHINYRSDFNQARRYIKTKLA
jgi:cell wall-associated NlpC family hydrolase